MMQKLDPFAPTGRAAIAPSAQPLLLLLASSSSCNVCVYYHCNVSILYIYIYICIEMCLFVCGSIYVAHNIVVVDDGPSLEVELQSAN